MSEDDLHLLTAMPSGASRELLPGSTGGKGKLFLLGEAMDLPRCGIYLCVFAWNPELSGVSHTSVLLICWVISWGQRQKKVSGGRSARDGAVAPLKALLEKEVPHPNYQGPRRWLPHKPVAPGLYGCTSGSSCSWTGHRWAGHAGISDSAVVTCPSTPVAKESKVI